MKKVKKNLKSSTGITLIALVITIIVLLILAGVAISMLTGDNGILNQAVRAKEETERKSMQENIQLAVLSAMSNTNHDLTLENLETEVKSQLGNDVEVEQDGIGGYVVGKNPDENGHLKDVYGVVDKEGKVGEGKWHFVKLTEAEEAKDKEIKISDGETTLTVGKEIDYSPIMGKDGNNFTTEELKDGKFTCTVKNLSDDKSEDTYTYKADGYEGKWGVLGAEDGKILIVSMKKITPTSTTATTENSNLLYIGGENGYQNGVKALNDIGKVYGYGKGAENARSITAEDINKITGYDPNYVGQNVNKTEKKNLELNKFDKGTIGEYGSEVKYYWDVNNENPIYECSNGQKGILNETSNSFEYYRNGWSTDTKPLDLKEKKYITRLTNTMYRYCVETLTATANNNATVGIGNTENASGKLAFAMLMNEGYWLGSTYEYSYSSVAEWGIFMVIGVNRSVWPFYLYESNEKNYKSSTGVRAVVVLSPDITVNGKGNIYKIEK